MHYSVCIGLELSNPSPVTHPPGSGTILSSHGLEEKLQLLHSIEVNSIAVIRAISYTSCIFPFSDLDAYDMASYALQLCTPEPCCWSSRLRNLPELHLFGSMQSGVGGKSPQPLHNRCLCSAMTGHRQPLMCTICFPGHKEQLGWAAFWLSPLTPQCTESKGETQLAGLFVNPGTRKSRKSVVLLSGAWVWECADVNNVECFWWPHPHCHCQSDEDDV